MTGAWHAISVPRRALPHPAVGGGDQRKNLEKLAHELGIDHRVVFHGRVTDQQLRATLTNGSVFAIASIIFVRVPRSIRSFCSKPLRAAFAAASASA